MSFGDRVKAASRELLLEVDARTEVAVNDLYSNIVARTPVDTGELRQSWVMSRIEGGFQISTDKPYAHVLEYGLYQNPVLRGSWNKKTKSWVVKTVNGFSIQAPKGFVRLAILDTKNKYGR